MRLQQFFLQLWIGSLVLPLAIQTTLAQSVPTVPARHPVTIDDVNRIQHLGGLQASPDGQWLSYTVRGADLGKDKDQTDLWMISGDGSRQVRLTSAGDVSGIPRWSGSSEFLGFLSKRGDEADKKKGAQLWVLDRRGGESRKLTDIAGGIEDFAWSPDGTRLVLVVADADPADTPETMEGWKRKTPPPIVIDRLHFKQDRDGYLGAQQTHLRLLDMGSGALVALTAGAYSESAPAWSPDGASIAFFSNRAGNPDATEERSLFVIAAAAGAAPRMLTTTTGERDSAPVWSPDGKSIAFLSGDPVRFSAYQRARLSLIAAAGGAPRVLGSRLDRAVHAPLSWSADGQSITATVEDDRAAFVTRFAIGDERVERLSSGRHLLSDAVTFGAGRLAVLASTAKQPAELHLLEAGQLRPLTHHNDAWLAELRLGTTDEFTSVSSDGTRVNGLVSKPPEYRAGQRYPTVLLIHGGPNSQDAHRYHGLRELMTGNGYVVLQVNYRGSSGRGDAFQKAIYADWGNREVKDLLGAVDWAVAAGIADPARLGLGGWSYGGILTDYTIASDTRFKAAVSGAGSANQTAMYGTDQYIVQYDQE
ncbi:MAG: S9 family peptidase, partial [Herminiimonas sp.]|nr:S9 family peptidase [Herminiimonas sp.]